MRDKNRVPQVMQFFRDDKAAFNDFVDNFVSHELFIDNYDELLSFWTENPDLRFTQLLYNRFHNNEIKLNDDYPYNREETIIWRMLNNE